MAGGQISDHDNKWVQQKQGNMKDGNFTSQFVIGYDQDPGVSGEHWYTDGNIDLGNSYITIYDCKYMFRPLRHTVMFNSLGGT